MSGGATTSSAATVQRSHSGRETSQMAIYPGACRRALNVTVNGFV